MFDRLALASLIVTGFLHHAGAAYNFNVGDDLFTNQIIPHVQVEVAAPAMEALRGYAFRQGDQRSERPEVLCTVREGASVWTNVALHLKGSASFRSVDAAPAFTLNFSKHILQQRFHGLEKISLNNSVQDPTRLSEKLCRELYVRGGVPVPRAGHITADLNGRPLGVFVLLEGWTRQFVQRYFSDPRGPLYEGPFLTDINRPLDVAYGNTNNQKLTIARLLAAAQEPDPAKRLAQLAAVLDLDRFTRLLAIDMLAWNGDGYGLHANNYRIFQDRSQGRFVFMPHGMDQMFTLPNAPVLAGGDGIVAWGVLSLPEGRRRVLERIREFRKSFFQTDAIRQHVLDLSAPVGAALARQANLTNAPAPPEYTAAVAAWLQQITNRLASIDEQLATITNLVPLRVGQPFILTGWTNRTIVGNPTFPPPTEPASLAIRTSPGSIGTWVTPLWLEHGRYQLQGRVRAILSAGATNQAGLRVRSSRKRTLGLDWGWDSRRRADYVPGGETGNLVYQPLPPAAGTNWTDLTCEIDLRQPAADLEIFCEASGTAEAWFDPKSLKLTRLTDSGR